MTGPARLPSITEDADALALLTAYEQGGALPTWTAEGSARAFAAAGYLDAEHPSRLSQRGMDVAATWKSIKDQTAAGFRRGGRFAAIAPGEAADDNLAARTSYVEEHYTPNPSHWRR